ncbi:hypothetical protein DRQ53_06080 [bacterium]|nr:MAG: hypothetical protein DRQ32_06560 [bacterium]RKZ16549.1 MAG: hypothetical protein DRQ53_06080 [bacterium]
MNVLLLLMSVVLIAFVVWPAFKRGPQQWQFSEEDTPLGRLATRREVLVGNLTDLDFEFAMGKVAEEDYMSLRNSLKQQTLRIMEQMEVLQGGKVKASEASKATPKAAGSPAPAADFCPACGQATPGNARFCPGCGGALVLEESR